MSEGTNSNEGKKMKYQNEIHNAVQGILSLLAGCEKRLADANLDAGAQLAVYKELRKIENELDETLSVTE